MTTIHCSQKLQMFLEELGPAQTDMDPVLGSWNADVFWIKRRRCVIFMNSKTCYSVLIPDVSKEDMGNLGIRFGESLLKQLIDDFQLTKRAELLVRHQLADIQLCKTNNNRRIIRAIKGHVSALPYYVTVYRPDDPWDGAGLCILLNSTPVTARVWANRDKPGEFEPKDAMGELLKSLEAVRSSGYERSP